MARITTRRRRAVAERLERAGAELLLTERDGMQEVVVERLGILQAPVGSTR